MTRSNKRKKKNTETLEQRDKNGRSCCGDTVCIITYLLWLWKVLEVDIQDDQPVEQQFRNMK